MLPQIDGHSEYPSIVENPSYHQIGGTSTRGDRGKVTIEMLPEEILLEIFSFYVFGTYTSWETLVHVCPRWRSIVFAAPRHLNLQLFFTGRTPVREMLDIWPALPIVVDVRGEDYEINDNILDALEKHDRICEVYVDRTSVRKIAKLARAMQVTFPALTHLDIHTFGPIASFPETLLGGSSPNLQSLCLRYIAFLALPKLLLSSPGLVSLSLFYISDPGYISSDAMVDCLSSLTRLEHLQIEFGFFPQPHPDSESRRPPLLTCTVFPFLSTLILKCVTEYLDQILAHIEAPYLNDATIVFRDLPSLHSMHITCPALPKLLLCSPGLVDLALIDIPCPEYISSNAIVDCLSSLAWIRCLEIKFPSSHPHPDSASTRLPPLTCTVLPILSTLNLEGTTEYLDQVLAHIEAPHINNVCISFQDPPNFDISRLSPCFRRTEKCEAFDQAWMRFYARDLEVALFSRKGTTGGKTITLSLRWKESAWKLLKLECCAPSHRPISFQTKYPLFSPKGVGITQWLEFLRVLTFVENLYLSVDVAQRMAPTFQEPVGEGGTQVLPALQTIFIKFPKGCHASEVEIIQEVMGELIAARELSGHPVAVNIDIEQ